MVSRIPDSHETQNSTAMSKKHNGDIDGQARMHTCVQLHDATVAGCAQLQKHRVRTQTQTSHIKYTNTPWGRWGSFRLRRRRSTRSENRPCPLQKTSEEHISKRRTSYTRRTTKVTHETLCTNGRKRLCSECQDETSG